MDKNKVVTFSGRSLDELNIDGVLSGDLVPEDFRISSQTLIHQADVAETAGYPQLAENLRRAAEITHMSNEQVLKIYNTLRPRRTSHAEMVALADRLENEDRAPMTAALVREAAKIYLQRGIVKKTA
jgi:propanediol dehydratase small subunit